MADDALQSAPEYHLFDPAPATEPQRFRIEFAATCSLDQRIEAHDSQVWQIMHPVDLARYRHMEHIGKARSQWFPKIMIARDQKAGSG